MEDNQKFSIGGEQRKQMSVGDMTEIKRFRRVIKKDVFMEDNQKKKFCGGQKINKNKKKFSVEYKNIYEYFISLLKST